MNGHTNIWTLPNIAQVAYYCYIYLKSMASNVRSRLIIQLGGYSRNLTHDDSVSFGSIQTFNVSVRGLMF